MSSRAIIRSWPIAVALFAIHSLFVAIIYILWQTNHDIERDMIWLTMYLVDLPISMAYQWLDSDSGLVVALTCTVIGGLQWTFVGSILDLLWKRFFSRLSPRSTPNI
jgi:hypothetical protein